MVLPSGIQSTGWPAVRDKCADFGVAFDPWQDGAGRVILSKRVDGSYACAIGGVVISIPRQVGKTFLIMSIAFALCLLFPGLRVMWTAHHSKTADETFEAMQGFARRKKIAPHIAKVMIDDMSVRFRNGSRIMFGARERGFGRGMSRVGLLVFDEAQILTERAVSDTVPTTNTVANALVIYTGTPPKPSDPSEVFTNRRSEALAGESDDLAYIEFSADSDAKPDDRKQWAKANPSYPTRTNAAAMLRMKKNLAPDSFCREGLGMWAERSAGSSVISSAAWSLLNVAGAPESGETSYGVKFSLDGESVALSVAQRSPSGRVHIEGISQRPMTDGTAWLVGWFKTRWDRCQAIVIDGKANAGAFRSVLLAAGCPESKASILSADQAVSAHGLFRSAVVDGTLSHLDDDVLAASVASAGKRNIGHLGGWGFMSIDGGDITLAESAVLAHFGTTIETAHVGFVPRRIR